MVIFSCKEIALFSHPKKKRVWHMDVKNNLNQIMVERNLSYRQLERMTGVSHSMLNKICMGETDPTQTTMILIAKGLKMKVTDVFHLDY